jgi:hypothetical protein
MVLAVLFLSKAVFPLEPLLLAPWWFFTADGLLTVLPCRRSAAFLLLFSVHHFCLGRYFDDL